MNLVSNMISLDSREYDDNFFVDVIKLVLCVLSKSTFPQDISKKVINYLEKFLKRITNRICMSQKFSVAKTMMESEIKVSS